MNNKEYRKEYYEINKDKLLARNKEYLKLNRYKIIECDKKNIVN